MRRIITVLVAAGLVVGMTVAPAAADAPVEFTFGAIITHADPCTGEPDVSELTFNVKAHEHQNNAVWVIDSYVETSLGYVGNGHETQVANQSKFVSVYNWVVENAETRARYLIKGWFFLDFDSGEVQRSGIELTCVGQAA